MLFANEFKWGICLLFAMGLSACGSSSNEDSIRSLPQTNNPDVPQYIVPITSNGFYLQSKTVHFGSELTFRETSYVLSETERTLTELDVDENGEGQITVVYRYDERGLITEQENLDSRGSSVQRFTSTYDNKRRIITQTSFNGDDGFLSISYRFNDVGAPFRKVVTSIQGDTEFSTTGYQFDNDRLLAASILSSPFLPGDVRREYSFRVEEPVKDNESSVEAVVAGEHTKEPVVEQRAFLESVTDDLGTRLEFEYDQNNNIASKTTYAESGEVIFRTDYQYEKIDAVVPNLPLYEIAYEYDQMF